MQKTYSRESRILHWLIALIILMQLCMGFVLDDLADDLRSVFMVVHKSFGITLLGLMGLRFYWLYRSGRPTLPATMPPWELWLSRGVQYMMYLLLLAMPIDGWIMSMLANHPPRYFGLFTLVIPGIRPDKALAREWLVVHQTLAWVLIGLIGLHISGAVKHAVVDKDKVFESMLP